MKQALTESPDNLQVAFGNLLQQLKNTPSEPPSFRDRFLVKQGQRLFSVSTEEIPYFFSRNKLTFLKTDETHEWLIDYTLDELEQMLDSKRFFRLNRQIVAQLRAVERVNLYFNGKLKLTLQPAFEEEVLVSREKAGDFKRWLGE
jgi:two-component system LytT family response regulator